MSGPGATESTITLVALQTVFPADDCTGTFSVEALPDTQWEATTEADWIAITSPRLGTGDGVVTYSLATNTAGPRFAPIRVANSLVSIHQCAAPNWLSNLVLGNKNVPKITEVAIADLAKKLNDLPLPLRAAGYAALVTAVSATTAETIAIYEAFPAVPHIFDGKDMDVAFVENELQIILKYIAEQATGG